MANFVKVRKLTLTFFYLWWAHQYEQPGVLARCYPHPWSNALTWADVFICCYLFFVADRTFLKMSNNTDQCSEQAQGWTLSPYHVVVRCFVRTSDGRLCVLILLNYLRGDNLCRDVIFDAALKHLVWRWGWRWGTSPATYRLSKMVTGPKAKGSGNTNVHVVNMQDYDSAWEKMGVCTPEELFFLHIFDIDPKETVEFGPAM